VCTGARAYTPAILIEPQLGTQMLRKELILAHDLTDPCHVERDRRLRFGVR
jgi:hypothetical protein